jgi:hypothetical protein
MPKSNAPRSLRATTPTQASIPRSTARCPTPCARRPSVGRAYDEVSTRSVARWPYIIDPQEGPRPGSPQFLRGSVGHRRPVRRLAVVERGRGRSDPERVEADDARIGGDRLALRRLAEAARSGTALGRSILRLGEVQRSRGAKPVTCSAVRDRGPQSSDSCRVDVRVDRAAVGAAWCRGERDRPGSCTAPTSSGIRRIPDDMSNARALAPCGPASFPGESREERSG